jgi:hypothetical protein
LEDPGVEVCHSVPPSLLSRLLVFYLSYAARTVFSRVGECLCERSGTHYLDLADDTSDL